MHMPIQAIVDDIKLSTRKPLEVRLVRPLKGGLPGFKPVQFLCLIIPILKAMRQRPLVKVLVILEALGLHVEVDKFVAWCLQSRETYPNATYEEKRRALRVLGILVTVYREDDREHDRYQITVRIPDTVSRIS